jgi:hypothetical protein
MRLQAKMGLDTEIVLHSSQKKNPKFLITYTHISQQLLHGHPGQISKEFLAAVSTPATNESQDAGAKAHALRAKQPPTRASAWQDR